MRVVTVLFCFVWLASAMAAAGAEGTFRAGAAAVDITPQQLPVSMTGSFQDRQAMSVHDPLHARVRHYRWRGVLLEPQTGPFRALQENYRGQDQLIFLNAAVSDRDGQAPLYVVPQEEGQPAWSQQIASFRPEVVLRHDDASLAVPVPRGIRNLADKMEPQLVDTMTFGSLLERFDIKRIDLLQIDAEGYDGELLRLFDFDRLQPSMIRYEHMHLSKKEQGACLDLLLDLGYLFTVGVSDTLAYRS